MDGGGEHDLEVLLATMRPVLQPGEFVFCSVEGEAPAGLSPIATIREPEGLSVVVDRSAAERHGLAFDFIAAWITLTVHSALDAVGLTAAVSSRLAAAGISANVIAGRFHDHLFVPLDRADEALALLGG
jgi:hypothetical protein